MTAVRRAIDGHRSAVQAWLVLAPVLLGFPGLTGLVNPVWGSLFGLPLFVAIAANAGVATLLVAYLLWPVVMLGMTTFAAGRLLESSTRWRDSLVLLWALSAFAVVPADVAGDLFASWPIYGGD